MDEQIIIEYVFKGVISLAVGTVIYILKDFKTSLSALTKSLGDVTLSLNTLITKDENNAEKMARMNIELERLQNDVDDIKTNMHTMDMKHTKEILEIKYRDK